MAEDKIDSVKPKEIENVTNFIPKKEIIIKENLVISDLLDDALIKIIKLIPIAQWASLEIVSHQFRRAVFAAWRSVKEIILDEQFVYRQIEFDNSRLSILKKILKKLSLRAPNIKSISGFSIFTKNSSVAIYGNKLDSLAEFNSLERISFDRSRIYFETLAKFLKTSKSRNSLKELDLSMSFNSADVRFDRANYSAFDKLVAVRSLKLDYYPYDTTKWQTWIDAGTAEKLTTLHFVASIENIKNFIFLINRSTELVNLGCRFDPKNHTNESRQLSLELLQSIASMPSENLSILKLHILCYAASNITRGTPGELIKFMGELGRRFRLTELNLYHSYHTITEALVAIADNLLHLKSLELYFPPYARTDSDISNNIASLLIYLTKKLTQLEKLALRGDPFTNDAITDDVISAMAKNLTKLKSLRLDYPMGGQDSLACLSELRELKELSIYMGYGPTRISMTTMKVWSECDMQFEILKLPNCKTLNIIIRIHRFD